jgi:hypothetical protein
MITAMGSVLGSLAAPDVPDTAARRRWPRRYLLVAVLVVVALVGVWLSRPKATEPDAFAAFAHRLDGLPTPGPPFTSYDPSIDGVDVLAPEGSWVGSGPGTWSSTVDPHWWISVHGWTATVPADRAAATCRGAAQWLAGAGTALGLPADGSGSGVPGCLSAVATVRSSSGSVSDAWSDRGSQAADGHPRYRTGVLVSGGPQPGLVTVVLLADATVANP